MKINLCAPLQTDSIVDGEGIRAVIWTQGCAHHCKGCHNPETHEFKENYLKDIDELKQEISSLSLIDGVTFSGGDPMFQPKQCAELAKYIKSIGLNVWAYTGYTFEELLSLGKHNKDILNFLENIDILVDGKFKLEKKSLALTYRGSANQRIINVKKSLNQNSVVLEKKYMEKEESLRPIYEHVYI